MMEVSSMRLLPEERSKNSKKVGTRVRRETLATLCAQTTRCKCGSDHKRPPEDEETTG
jgi:hypothetical protein